MYFLHLSSNYSWKLCEEQFSLSELKLWLGLEFYNRQNAEATEMLLYRWVA